MDEVALAVPASERHHSFVFVYYVLSLSFSLSLSLSPDTWDGGAQPVVDVRTCPGVLLEDNDHTIHRRKCRCIEEEEIGEALTRCAGPPAAVLSTSAGGG